MKDTKRGSAFAALLLVAVLLAGCAAEPAVSTVVPTVVPTTEPTEIPTQVPTEAPTAPPTEPQPEHFVLTLVGDCTFGCNSKAVNNKIAFPLTVGEDYGYPFRNVLDYFQNDDYSLINLEGVLGEKGSPRKKTFVFRGMVPIPRSSPAAPWRGSPWPTTTLGTMAMRAIRRPGVCWRRPVWPMWRI